MHCTEQSLILLKKKKTNLVILLIQITRYRFYWWKKSNKEEIQLQITGFKGKGNYKYHFLDNDFLFSSGIKNDANIFFVNCNSLNDAHDSIINRKVYKSLGVIQLDQIKNWGKLKGVSNWVNAILTDSDEPLNSGHFALGFETEYRNGLLNFVFSLLNEKSSLLSFQIRKLSELDKVSISKLKVL